MVPTNGSNQQERGENQVVSCAVMAVFAALGAVDRILGNRFGLGKEFGNGILAMALWMTRKER